MLKFKSNVSIHFRKNIMCLFVDRITICNMMSNLYLQHTSIIANNIFCSVRKILGVKSSNWEVVNNVKVVSGKMLSNLKLKKPQANFVGANPVRFSISLYRYTFNQNSFSIVFGILSINLCVQIRLNFHLYLMPTRLLTYNSDPPVVRFVSNFSTFRLYFFVFSGEHSTFHACFLWAWCSRKDWTESSYDQCLQVFEYLQ